MTTKQIFKGQRFAILVMFKFNIDGMNQRKEGFPHYREEVNRSTI